MWFYRLCYPIWFGRNWHFGMQRAPREVLVERFGNLLLPLGGKYEYKRVRGKQGRKRDKFQGYTPKQTHFTELHDTAQEAAVALANLKQELAAGYDSVHERKPRKKRGCLFRMCNFFTLQPSPQARPPLQLSADLCRGAVYLCWQKMSLSHKRRLRPSWSSTRSSSRPTR